jgi:L-amino acid N-acyltransferase YncA
MTDRKGAEVEIRSMRPDDWPRVAAIYKAGIATGDATFETEAPPWDSWHRGHLTEPRLVACRQGVVVGWAALSPVSERCV